MTWRADRDAQLQLLESVLVALFVFVAIAVVAGFRLPTSPQTFEQVELENVATDALKVRMAKVPAEADDCNENPCPFETDLDRLVSLAFGYRGATVGGPEESPSSGELSDFFGSALPPGAQYYFAITNGVQEIQVVPLNVRAPAVPVVVAHAVTSINWTVHASHLDEAVSLRLGENTGFETGVTALNDSLNRSQSEHGTPLIDLFAGPILPLYCDLPCVPRDAIFGTYQAFNASRCQTQCQYFTVTPTHVVGAGAQVRLGEGDVREPLKPKGTWAPYAKNGTVDGDDILFLDLDESVKISVGDIRLQTQNACRPGGILCRPGSFVRAGDSGVENPLTALPNPVLKLRSSADVCENATVGEGDAWYVFLNGEHATPQDGDIRLSRVGLHPMGSRYSPSDEDDVGIFCSLLDDPGGEATVQWADLNDNWTIEEGEPVYLNFVGLGQTPSLEDFDLHISGIGLPTQRAFYDLKVVTWYAV